MCAARRVHFARPWIQASEPAPTASNLAEKRRADALHVAFFQQNQAPETGTIIDCCCCVYSRMIYVATKDARWVRCPTASCSLGSLLLCIPGSARLDFYVIKTDAIFRFYLRWTESSDFDPKSYDSGHRVHKWDFIPSDFAISCLFAFWLVSHTKIILDRSQRSIYESFFQHCFFSSIKPRSKGGVTKT